MTLKDNSQLGRLKVLYAFYVSGHKANGALVSLTLMLKNIDNSIEPYFCSNEPLPERYGISNETARLKLSPPVKRNRFRALLSIIVNNYHVFLFLKRNRIQLIHINDSGMFWNVVLAAKIAGVKVLLNLRDTYSAENELTSSTKHKLMGGLANKVVTLSEEMSEHWKERMGGQHGDNDKFAYVYSARDTYDVDPSDLEVLRDKYNIPSDKFIIIVPAAFTLKKQQYRLIESFESLPELAKRKIILLFAGDLNLELNPYACKCFNRVESAGLHENIRFLGYQDNIGAWLKIADICLLASTNEGLARGTIDAMSMGTPVICFDFCSAREVIGSHEAGIVVPMNDFSALWETVLRYVYSDHSILKSQGVRGFAAANKLFDPQANAASYFSIYQKLICN